MWALGVLTYEFLFGSPPFERDNEKETLKAIQNVDYKFPTYFSLEAREFISKVAQDT